MTKSVKLRLSTENLEEDDEVLEVCYILQKTCWTIHSSFLVLSVLEKGFTLDVITRGQSTTILLCNWPFSAW